MAVDWGKIHLLEGRLRLWHGKANYRRGKLHKYKEDGNREHYWIDRHRKRHEEAAAKRVEAQLGPTRAFIAKWTKLLDEAEHEIHALERAIAALKPKGAWWPMGSWVRPGQAYRPQREDQGRDLEVERYHSVVAPGPGQCLQYGHDRAFPYGFGTHAIVRIDAGRFHDMAVRRGVAPDWYVGHAEEILVSPGQHFVAGQPIARLNNSLNPGWGWVEIGHYPYGGMGEGASWEPALFAPVYRA